MTIKLSTTNSVNKTLQHKALWELETPYWEVGGPSWLLWTPEMVESFLWERSTGFCIRTRREDYCLSSSVNKLSASMSETALFDTATRDRNSFRGPASLCEMHRKKNQHFKLSGPFRNDLEDTGSEKWRGGSERVIRSECYVPRSLLCRSPDLSGWQRNHLGQWPPWLKRLSCTQDFTKIKALDYLPSKNIAFPQEQTKTKKS